LSDVKSCLKIMNCEHLPHTATETLLAEQRIVVMLSLTKKFWRYL